mmetsp:Transcript_74589/g.210334  ORF Transcript_74589/g.210334 Transcript_74589/m.210334 type:complete len:125 (+) Transcript_74589:1-375(+)
MSGLWRLSLLVFFFLAVTGVARAEEEDDESMEHEGADPSPDDPKEIIETMDKDKDGKLSFEEIYAGATEDDSEEGEGGSDEEFKVEFKEKLTKLFSKSDADGDGFLDETEISTLIAAFTEADEL